MQALVGKILIMPNPPDDPNESQEVTRWLKLADTVLSKQADGGEVPADKEETPAPQPPLNKVG